MAASRNQDSEEEMESQRSPMDDASLEQAAVALFQKFPIPKARLSASAVNSITKTIGVELPDQLAEFLGDKAMKELRYVLLLATQFNRHERALGLRASDFSKALSLINCFDSENREENQTKSQDQTSTFAETSRPSSVSAEQSGNAPPKIFLHHFNPYEDEDLINSSRTTKVKTEQNEEEGWQDYKSNTSSGDKESPGDSSEGSASAHQEQMYENEGPDSEERENNNFDNNDIEFDSKMLPDSCDNIENEIGDEFLDGMVDDQDGESLDYGIQPTVATS